VSKPAGEADEGSLLVLRSVLPCLTRLRLCGDTTGDARVSSTTLVPSWPLMAAAAAAACFLLEEEFSEPLLDFLFSVSDMLQRV